MSNLTIQRVGYACGARVTGLDLSRPLPAADLEAIHKAWLEHQVLVFPGQKLDPHSLVAFTRHFGELDDYSSQPFNRHPDIKEVFVLTNRWSDGKPSKTYNAGQNWHTDLSYTVRPAKGTSVYCMEKPSVGGDTMFASMYLAYETLSPKMREFLDGLECVHDVSLVEGLDKRGPDVANEFRRLNPPVVHPAVRLHPESGRQMIRQLIQDGTEMKWTSFSSIDIRPAGASVLSPAQAEEMIAALDAGFDVTDADAHYVPGFVAAIRFAAGRWSTSWSPTRSAACWIP